MSCRAKDPLRKGKVSASRGEKSHINYHGEDEVRMASYPLGCKSQKDMNRTYQHVELSGIFNREAMGIAVHMWSKVLGWEKMILWDVGQAVIGDHWWIGVV